MIDVHKLNGSELSINAQLIESVECCPDTRVTLLNGKQLYVQEKPDELKALILAWQQRVNRGWHGDCDSTGAGSEPQAAAVGDNSMPQATCGGED